MLKVAPRLILNLCALALMLINIGCAGYGLAADQDSVFGESSKTLKVKGVDYPTIQPWVPHAIRSALRDELAARHMVSWVDSGSADFEIQIKIISLTSREWVASDENTTALYDNTIILEAIVYSGATNHEAWRSGAITYSDREELPADRIDSSEIITQAMRLLADKMRQAF